MGSFLRASQCYFFNSFLAFLVYTNSHLVFTKLGMDFEGLNHFFHFDNILDFFTYN
jgi:hypothetical protein